MKNEIIHTKVSMNQCGFIFVGNIFWKPVHQPIERIRNGNVCLANLTRPARDLSGKIITRLTKTFQSKRYVVKAVDCGDGVIHLLINNMSFVGLKLRQGLVNKDSPIKILHDKKCGSNNVFIFAIGQHLRNRNTCIGYGFHDSILSINRMRRGQQGPSRFFSEDKVFIATADFEGGI